jgi:hypothetical protein
VSGGIVRSLEEMIGEVSRAPFEVRAPPALRRRGAAEGQSNLVAAATIAAGLLTAAYVAFLGSLGAVPYQDAPNHLARAVIASDILFHGGRRFGELFSFQLALAPYALGDVALASLVAVLGPYGAERLWVVVVMASLPAATVLYLKTLRYPPYAVAVGAIVALYLSTDWFFVAGFQAFRLGVALTLVALAGWQRFLEAGAARWYLLYAAGLAAGYLTHLSVLVFCGAGVCVTGALAVARGRAAVSRVVAGGLPLAALLGWSLASGGGVPAGASQWDPPLLKIKRTFQPFHRYGYLPEGALCALLAAAHAFLLGGWRVRWRRERAVTAASLAATFLALYAVMPMSHGYVCWIDCRALPFVPLFVLFAALAVAGERPRHAWAVAALACALATGNLLLLREHLGRHDEVMRKYRAIAAQVPPGAMVLPVATRPEDHATNPYLHAGSFATIEAAARTPYLFAGGVTPYFTWRSERPSAPSEFWYQERRSVSFQLVAAGLEYDFLLVMKPYDPARGPWVATEVVAENDAAALLRIVHGDPGDERLR